MYKTQALHITTIYYFILRIEVFIDVLVNKNHVGVKKHDFIKGSFLNLS